MPEIAKLAGLILDILRDFIFVVGNAKIRPASARQLGADKIRAIHLSAIVLVVLFTAAIRAIPAGNAPPFDLMFFLVITLVYYSVIGAAISLMFSKWQVLGEDAEPTNDAMTIVLGFNLVSLLLLLIVFFFAPSLVLRLNKPAILGGLTLAAVIVAGVVVMARSEVKTFGALKIGAIVMFLVVTAWFYIRYVVLQNFVAPQFDSAAFHLIGAEAAHILPVDFSPM